MPIKANQDTIKAFNREMSRLSGEVSSLTFRALSYLGELCVAKVRDRSGQDSWYDITGNLRSSVGYVIARDGVILASEGFRQVKDGSGGVKEGRELAEELARAHGSGYALVVVAGMSYAEYVEAMDNKDVLASAELWAKAEAPKVMEKLRKQITSSFAG